MKLDPVQQKEFMDQYEREKSTLLGLAQPAKQPTIGEQFEQGTIEKNGTLYQRGKDGSFDVLREAPEDTSQADKEKYSKLLQAEAIRLAKDAEDTEGDLSSYIDQAQKNLAGVGFQRPANDWGEVTKPQQQVQPTTVATSSGTGDISASQPTTGSGGAAPVSKQTIGAAKNLGFKPVRTPEEAAALSAGTRFITPDGRTGTARGRQQAAEPSDAGLTPESVGITPGSISSLDTDDLRYIASHPEIADQNIARLAAAELSRRNRGGRPKPSGERNPTEEEIAAYGGR